MHCTANVSLRNAPEFVPTSRRPEEKTSSQSMSANPFSSNFRISKKDFQNDNYYQFHIQIIFAETQLNDPAQQSGWDSKIDWSPRGINIGERNENDKRDWTVGGTVGSRGGRKSVDVDIDWEHKLGKRGWANNVGGDDLNAGKSISQSIIFVGILPSTRLLLLLLVSIRNQKRESEKKNLYQSATISSVQISEFQKNLKIITINFIHNLSLQKHL